MFKNLPDRMSNEPSELPLGLLAERSSSKGKGNDSPPIRVDPIDKDDLQKIAESASLFLLGPKQKQPLTQFKLK
jgi:hypothetical protein